MPNPLTGFFKAPNFPNDPDKTRRAQVLTALHLNMGGAMLVLGVIGVLFFFAEKVITSAILATGVLAVLISIALNRRGHVRASALVILTFLWVLAILMTTVSGGMRSLDVMFFVSGTVIAGISLGAGAALLYAALSLLAGVGLIFAESLGVVFPQLFTFPPIAAWIILFINLVFTIVPLQVTLRNLADSAAQSRRDEERYRSIASIISDYVFWLRYGPSGEIADQWTGGAFESITGYSPGEFHERGGWASIVYPEDKEQDARDMAELRANRQVVTEIRLVRKDGAVRWARSYVQPIWDHERGQLAGIYGAVQDITEQKLTGRTLHQRMEEVAALYRLSVALTGGQNLYEALRAFVRELKQIMIVDAFHIGMYDAETDIFSYSLFLNLGEDILPPPRKLSEKPGLTWEVISNRKTLYLKDVADPQTRRGHNIVVVVDAPIRSYVGIPLVLQDRVIGIMSVQSLKAGAYTEDQIRLLEMLAAQVVITIEKLRLLDQLRQELEDRNRADLELQQREAILEIVAGAANTFLNMSEWSLEVWRTEVNNLLEQLGATIRASHSYVFENHPFEDGSTRMSMRYEWTAPGYESDLDKSHYQNMPIGQDNMKSWNDHIYRGLPFIGDDAHLTLKDMENLRNRGIQALLDVPIFVDGEWWGIIGFDDLSQSRNWSTAEVDALVVAANLLGAAIKRRQMDSIQKDELLQRKVLIDELESKNTELERFNYTVSHDLKSPLVTIKGFLGYLEEDASAGNVDRLKRDIKRIANAVDKMNALLSDLLELSRIGRGMESLEWYQMEELIREAIDLTHGRLDARKVLIEYQPNLPNVYVNKRRMVEVLQNLIDNAAKYMGEQFQPHIVIGMDGHDASGLPVFFVRDNGMGIAPEYHDRIFRLFDKLDASSEGTGVGLALVKRIIEFHGGRIWVASEAGEGTSFFFTVGRTGGD